MKAIHPLFQQGDHRWLMIARDPSRPDYLIDTNEYVVTADSDTMMTDPGGSELFPVVFAALATQVDPSSITALFASHQDPDIISSLSLWLEFKPDIKCYTSWLWAGFLPHFGGTADTFIKIPDAGMSLTLGRKRLEAVPAHYLHSSGNFHLYDPTARILFCGDVGAALLPPSESAFVVKDFDRHIRFAEGFHRRWMGSNTAKRAWCERVSRLDIDMLCPQHGACYQGADVGRFIDWFDHLEVGITQSA